jgi:hypothetical protein
MSWLRVVYSFILVAAWAAGADLAVPAKSAAGDAGSVTHTSSLNTPPVLRNSDAADTGVFRLPGPPRPTAAVVRPSGPLTGPAEQADLHREPAVAPALKPSAPPPSRAFPAEFQRESGLYCQKRIGQWKESDALALLGDPSRRRAASDDDGSDGGDGHILAFDDPTGRYKELELDFDKDSGQLRTVFAYPRTLSWQECRRVWGSDVTSTHANNGRIFHSYLNRHLDVLVDPSGQVISLGLY